MKSLKNITIKLTVFQDIELAICHHKLVSANFLLKHPHRKTHLTTILKTKINRDNFFTILLKLMILTYKNKKKKVVYAHRQSSPFQSQESISTFLIDCIHIHEHFVPQAWITMILLGVNRSYCFLEQIVSSQHHLFLCWHEYLKTGGERKDWHKFPTFSKTSLKQCRWQQRKEDSGERHVLKIATFFCLSNNKVWDTGDHPYFLKSRVSLYVCFLVTNWEVCTQPVTQMRRSGFSQQEVDGKKTGVIPL